MLDKLMGNMRVAILLNYVMATGLVILPWAISAACLTYILRETMPWIF